MNRYLLLILSLISFFSQAQILDPVAWTYESNKIGDDEFELNFIASIEDDWAIYSHYLEDGGPLPTNFAFTTNSDYELVGQLIEHDINKVTKYDSVFDMVVTKFYKEARFTQRIKLVSKSSIISGNLEYMTCDDTQCTFKPDNPFMFQLSLDGELIAKDTTINQMIVDDNEINLSLYGLLPAEMSKLETVCQNDTLTLADSENKNSLWGIFGLGFLGGLLALLTPCVFPMIPLTVSFFTKKKTERSSGISRAILYGFFILAVYLILSIPFHLIDSINPDILNEISTNVTLNILFFIIFLFFAFSFFGYYELTLPSSWTNKTSQGESLGGVLGVFFMALTLAIVSFSCTGPILGSLLAGSLTAEGGAWQLTFGMGGFGLALGLPFALFAMFPNLLNTLPKSGGWLNTTKVVLGFLELALAFKFLSNADLVKHWGFLKIEIFLGIWIVIFLCLALYLFGKIKFPHDSVLNKLSFIRLGFGMVALLFTFYLFSGFQINKSTKTFSPLTLLSGLAPPVGYSLFYPNECPNNLNCFKGLKEGINYAKQVGKPIILDFTGFACVNCRKMEEHIWPDPKIDALLREKFVLISLYVDDKKELPNDEQIFVNRINGGTRQLKNYGHKWAHFQTQFFQSNSQPFYVLLDSEGEKLLNKPVGYTPDVEEYASFLECGLQAFISERKNASIFEIN
ncbi:thioredoxin family protein [Flavobacteriaceae bacterium]|nr:thioredoxin family protein [Flavobacteriaceae bacterium]MDC3326774.1 thioredoxin family protein [Flavobacteriaceae bacterium]